jgi:hypothetical protein
MVATLFFFSSTSGGDACPPGGLEMVSDGLDLSLKHFDLRFLSVRY